jgi:hypothetical protein
MKVYVLTQGEYSDYHIIGVYSTKEKAQEVCDAMQASRTFWDKPQIEDYELDELSPSMGCVCVGYTPEHNTARSYGFIFASGTDSINSYTKPPEFMCYLPYSPRLSDPNVLLKAAQDRYMKWKAEQELF